MRAELKSDATRRTSTPARRRRAPPSGPPHRAPIAVHAHPSSRASLSDAKEGSRARASARAAGAAAMDAGAGGAPGGELRLHVKTLDNHTYDLAVPRGATVHALKLLLEGRSGAAASNQRLIFRGRVMADVAPAAAAATGTGTGGGADAGAGATLESFGVEDGDTLHLVVRPLGVLLSDPADVAPPAQLRPSVVSAHVHIADIPISAGADATDGAGTGVSGVPDMSAIISETIAAAMGQPQARGDAGTDGARQQQQQAQDSEGEQAPQAQAQTPSHTVTHSFSVELDGATVGAAQGVAGMPNVSEMVQMALNQAQARGQHAQQGQQGQQPRQSHESQPDGGAERDADAHLQAQGASSSAHANASASAQQGQQGTTALSAVRACLSSFPQRFPAVATARPSTRGSAAAPAAADYAFSDTTSVHSLDFGGAERLRCTSEAGGSELGEPVDELGELGTHENDDSASVASLASSGVTNITALSHSTAFSTAATIGSEFYHATPAPHPVARGSSSVDGDGAVHDVEHDDARQLALETAEAAEAAAAVLSRRAPRALTNLAVLLRASARAGAGGSANDDMRCGCGCAEHAPWRMLTDS